MAGKTSKIIKVKHFLSFYYFGQENINTHAFPVTLISEIPYVLDNVPGKFY